jgi:hypothetical protein
LPSRRRKKKLKIFIVINEENELQGWSKNRNTDSEIEVEVTDDHPIQSIPFKFFKYINGEVVKDDSVELDRSKKKKTEELSNACQKAILGYFEATVNSVAYLFSFDREAQTNFTGTLALFTEGLITEMEWTAHREGVAERIVLDKVKFLQVIAVAFQHKNMKVAKYRNQLVPLVEQATTLEEVADITW